MISKRALLRTLEREREAFVLERAHLIDVICHLSRNPWTLPPREKSVPEPPDEVELDLLDDPAQLPDY